MLVSVQTPVMNRSKSYEWVYIDVLGGEGEGGGNHGNKNRDVLCDVIVSTEMYKLTFNFRRCF